jgi:type VI secretion system protein ImpB
MDGKTGAEELIAKVIKDPALLKSLAARAKPATATTLAAESAHTAARDPT